VRKLIRAPAPSSTTSAFSAMVHWARLCPASWNGSGIEAGIQCQASRTQVSTAAKPAEPASHAALPAPPPAAAAWMDSIVSAVAVPVGKARPSWLMSWRLIGMAAKTPSAAITPNHATIASGSGRTVVIMKSAPKAAMLPPPVM
jgi:hypothetical protein